MKQFPTVFSDQIRFLTPEETRGITRSALVKLAQKGFHVQLGLTREDIAALQSLSVQTSVRKYCPRDCTERFKDEPTIEEWLTKERLAFLLKHTETGELGGIAWTGPGTSPHIPDGKLTGGVRLSEEYQGLGLATPFLTVVLDYTHDEYSDKLLWFECWESNEGAVHIYQRLGFEIVEKKAGQRETPSGSFEPDNRIYMKLTKSGEKLYDRN